jgi:hypothetical protein
MEEIVTPEWVPPPVIVAAQRLADAAGDGPPEVLDVVRRLIIDGRMQGVWQDLQKHQRDGYTPTAVPFYKTELPGAVRSWGGMVVGWRSRAAEYRALGDEAAAARFEDLASNAETQPASGEPASLNIDDERELVLVLVFVLAFSLYCSGLETVGRADVEKRAAALRGAGSADMADAFERQAAISENSRFIVERKRGDQRIRAFVEGMAKEMRVMFGQDMPGVIATITNVAFQQSDYNRDRIRALLEIRP